VFSFLNKKNTFTDPIRDIGFGEPLYITTNEHKPQFWYDWSNGSMFVWSLY